MKTFTIAFYVTLFLIAIVIAYLAFHSEKSSSDLEVEK